MSRVGSGLSPLSEIQALIDEMSETLQRSVAVDNPHLELLCASAQIGPVDKWRVNAIINRRSPEGPVPWMLEHGIATARTPIRLPHNAEFGLLPRVCFPIRDDVTLLGYLWLVDEPPVTAEEMTLTARTVAELALVMRSDDESLRARAHDLERLTLEATQTATSVDAIGEAVQRGYLTGHAGFLVHVHGLRPRRASNRTLARDHKDLQFALARRQIGRTFLASARDSTIVTISNPISARHTDELQTQLRRRIAEVGHEVVSAGSATADEPIELEVALDRARFAAALSALVGSPSTVTTWEDLGSWRLLHGHRLAPQTVADLSPAAARLISEGSPEHWQTALAYLDAARSVPPTCKELSIHRATLYYRLDRVRDLLGAEALDDGWSAASLHVALKLHSFLIHGTASD